MAAVNILSNTDFDTLVAEAGTVALDELLARHKSLRRIIWVTKAGSSHLDWDEVPEGIGGNVEVNTWSTLIEEKKAGASNEVPGLDKDNEPLPVYAFWQNKSGKHDVIEYSQKVCSKDLLLKPTDPCRTSSLASQLFNRHYHVTRNWAATIVCYQPHR